MRTARSAAARWRPVITLAEEAPEEALGWIKPFLSDT
jgi:hypothetical protein